jgi:hypothetical protein
MKEKWLRATRLGSLKLSRREFVKDLRCASALRRKNVRLAQAKGK